LALAASAVGWAILGFAELVVWFTGEEVNCTANRGDAYQRCVRNSDLTGLWIHSMSIGLAMVALVVVVRGRRRQRRWRDPRIRVATALSVSLVVAGVVVWIGGYLRRWEPDRPFPYEPITTSQANIIMVTGVIVGLLIGALLPLGRRDRDAEPGSETADR
jgi:drug/metabolite transporter (DMT)-like permease